MSSGDLRTRLARLRNKADNYLAAATLPFPAPVHAEGLRHGMREIFEELRGIVAALDAEHDQEGVGYECTGGAASWCPIHGDCECPRAADGERIDVTADCPLHGPDSDHAEEGGHG